jgi:voltage-gated potassium channel
MFKLCNLHPRLKVIITSMSYSSSVLSLLMFFFFLAIMIAGSLMYYVERLSNSSDNQLISIVEGIWFAISTISTLGLGDIVPKSSIGMILGAITTVAGVLIIDLPMPIIVETFANFNSHLQTRQQLPKQRRRITPTVMSRKIKPQMPPNGHVHQNRF